MPIFFLFQRSIYSIFHFFKTLIQQKSQFANTPKLEDFPFDTSLFTCHNAGQFPDLAIKLSQPNPLFTGGELIELKDSETYSVAPFNSTIPTGRKDIEKVVKSKHGIIRQQMEQAGDDIFSLPERHVFNLIRGINKKTSAQKRLSFTVVSSKQCKWET